MVAESLGSGQPKPYIRVARRVAVAPLEAQVYGPAHGEIMEVWFRKECRWRDECYDVHRRERRRIGHQRQLDQILDCAAPELRPDTLVFALYVLIRRM